MEKFGTRNWYYSAILIRMVYPNGTGSILHSEQTLILRTYLYLFFKMKHISY